MSNSSCENFQSSAILVSLIFFIWLNKMKVTIGCKKIVTPIGLVKSYP